MVPVNLRSEASANTIPPAAQKELRDPFARDEGWSGQMGYGEL